MKLTNETLDRLVQKGLIKSYSYVSEESYGRDGRIEAEYLRIVFTDDETINISATDYRSLDIY